MVLRVLSSWNDFKAGIARDAAGRLPARERNFEGPGHLKCNNPSGSGLFYFCPAIPETL